MRLWPLLLSGCLLAAQEAPSAAQPFQEEPNRWWLPTGSLRLEQEYFDLGPTREGIHRTRGRAHLQWTFDLGPLQLTAGSLHTLSSTSNRTDVAWFENLRSNGSSLDLAALKWRPTGERGGGELSGGLLENPLVSGESLWDPNLRVIGGGGRLFWRSETVEELGLRAVRGQVRLIEGGRVSLTAAQAVFRFDTGPLQWTLHGGDWRLDPRDEDAPRFLRQNPGGLITSYGAYGPTTTYLGYRPDQYEFHVVGLGIAAQGPLPFELRGQRQMHVHEEGRGEELQVWIGSPRRAWWPQAAWIRQRVDPLGALASVNGDQWWFHANADGNLFLLALNLPHAWRLEARHMEQVKRGTTVTITRQSLALIARF